MERFEYHCPGSVDEAADLLVNISEARPLSGGQSLLPMMKQRLVLPPALVDLRKIDALRGITLRGDRLFIGASERHCDVAASSVVAQVLPMLAELASGIGDVQVRYRGTIGGSLANNDPAADYPAACLALDAVIVTNKRTVEAANFFLSAFETALEDGEIITGVEFPLPHRAKYLKFRHMISRYALVGVCVAQTRAGARVAVTGAAHSVFRLPEFEAVLNSNWSPTALLGAVVDASMLTSDVHAHADYRAHMIPIMTRDAIMRTLGGG